MKKTGCASPRRVARQRRDGRRADGPWSHADVGGRFASAVSEFEFSELDFDNCLGSGTYGAVLSGKFISGELTGKDVAAKFPRRLSTWWGTRFNDAERDLLHNLQQKVGVHRNIIRLLGNVSVPNRMARLQG